MFKFLFLFFILFCGQKSLADINIPLIILIQDNGSLLSNCSNLNCPELALISDHNLKIINLEKSENLQKNTLPYQNNLKLSPTGLYELLIP